jgi:hypothetical protein
MRTLLFVMALTSCAASSPTPSYPEFAGHETEAWIAYEEELPDRDPADLLQSFEASARSHGCHTERLGSGADPTIGGGELRHMYGITASCEEGTLALATMTGRRVSVGCTKPTTREQCDLLLSKISEAR